MPSVSWSEVENLDPYEPYVSPAREENLDPSEPAEGSYTLPEYAKGYGAGKAALVGTGRGLTKVGRGAKDLILAGAELLGGDYTSKLAKERRKELADLTTEENRYWEEGLANKESGVSGWAKGGEFAGEVLPAFAVPGSGAGTLLARAASNAGRQGLLNAATTQGNVVDRAAAGGTGAIGGGLGSIGGDVIAKGFGGAMGKWGDPVAKQVNDRLVAMGLKPRIGDLAGRENAHVVRGMENWASHLPVSKGDVIEQQEKLRRLIVPDKMSGENMVTKAVKTTDQKVREHADDIYAPVKQKIGKTSILIDPTNTHVAAAKLKAEYPGIFDGTYYKQSDLDAFNKFVDSPTSLTYDEFRNIQQILGAAQGRAQNMVNKGEIVGNAVGDAKQAYKTSKLDFETWGQNSSPSAKRKYAQIVKEHNDATARWEKEVLPWKQSDVAQDLRNISTFGAPDTARVLTRADTDKADLVRHYLKQYGPEGNADLADALSVMRRSAQGLASATDDEVVHSGSLLSGILAPGLITGATGSAKMSANNFGKAMYFGDSMDAMTSPVMRGYLGASGEVGEDQLSTLMVIKELYNQLQEKYGDQSIGSKTESGAAAGQQGERK
jgi:hypothetical protein